MDRCIVFAVGAVSSVISEIFWRGECRRSVALWGGIGMLLLRRIVLRFPFESRALLCVCGAVLLLALCFVFLLLRLIITNRKRIQFSVIPSFSYSLYRFLLIAPAYTIIEYLEARFGM